MEHKQQSQKSFHDSWLSWKRIEVNGQKFSPGWLDLLLFYDKFEGWTSDSPLLWRIQKQGVAKGGPDRAQVPTPIVHCALQMKIEKKSIYSDRTVKYSIKAVRGTDCAQPTRNSGYASVQKHKDNNTCDVDPFFGQYTN